MVSEVGFVDDQNYAQMAEEPRTLLFAFGRCNQYPHRRDTTSQSNHKSLGAFTNKPLAFAPPRCRGRSLGS